MVYAVFAFARSRRALGDRFVDVFPYHDEGGISAERLALFYQRCGCRLEHAGRGQTVRLDLRRFAPFGNKD